MANDGHSTLFRVVFFVVEFLAIVAGLALSTFSLMAVVGEFSSNLWMQLGIGGIVALFIPFLLADRFLPEGDRAARVRGLVTDVLAVTWLGFGFLFTVVAGPATGGALRNEAELLSDRGVPGVERVVSTLLGPRGGSSAAASEPASSTPPDVDAADVAGRDGGDTTASGDATADTGGDDASAADEEAESEGDPEDSDGDMTPSEVFEQTAPAVVSVRTKRGHPLRKQREVKAGGTGFFVDDGGIIATNQHVIGGAKSAEIKLWDGRKTDEVMVLDTDEELDLALLEIDFDDLEGEMNRELPGDDDEVDPIPLGNSEDVSVGQQAVAIGNPLGLEHTLTDGIVSQRRVYEGKKVIQVSVPLSPGNSGGPLMNMSGEAIGVSKAKLGNAYNRGDALNLAVPINKLEEMIDSEYPGKHEVGEEDPSDKGTW